MPSNFAKAGKTLESSIPVPDLPMDSIRNGARTARVRHQWRVLVTCALAIVVLGSGTVLAAKIFPFRLWLFGNRAATTPIRSFTTYLGPDEATLRHVVSQATFPVVLPTGLPSGERVLRLMVMPADHPSVITIMYHRNSGDIGFTLIDASLVQNGSPPSLAGVTSGPISKMHYWRAGGEVVISQNPAQWSQDASIKAAMLRATPEGSLAQTISRLYRITSAGGFLGAANIADALAPSDGHSTFLGRESLAQVSARVRARKGIFVTQWTRVENIATVRGTPDLGHASFHPGPLKLAVSSDGVRAIAAVLATNACGNAPNFTCEMLINERNGTPYRIWVLPIRSPQSPERFTVDPKSFRVERTQ